MHGFRTLSYAILVCIVSKKCDLDEILSVGKIDFGTTVRGETKFPHATVGAGHQQKLFRTFSGAVCRAFAPFRRS